jgi:beta-glucanase (GH16 family)
VRRFALLLSLLAATSVVALPPTSAALAAAVLGGSGAGSQSRTERPQHPRSDDRRHHSRKHRHRHRRPQHRNAQTAASPVAVGPVAAAPAAAGTAGGDPVVAVAPNEPVAAPAKGGVQPGGGAARQPVWADEFSGPADAAPDPARWNFDVGGNGWGNEELQYYTARASNASLDGEGNLAITARKEAYVGADGVKRRYTSARLQTLEKMEFTYGQLEARISVPPGQGLAPAFWTLGNEAYEGEDGRWPECGEIDVMEILGSEPDVLNGTLHGPWPTAPHGIGSELAHSTPLTAGFHTYGVNWEPERISFLLDGLTYAAVSREDLPPGDPWPFQHPNFLLLNLAVGGEWPGSPDASTQFPARMLVDWVRVWQ